MNYRCTSGLIDCTTWKKVHISEFSNWLIIFVLTYIGGQSCFGSYLEIRLQNIHSHKCHFEDPNQHISKYLLTLYSEHVAFAHSFHLYSARYCSFGQTGGKPVFIGNCFQWQINVVNLLWTGALSSSFPATLSVFLKSRSDCHSVGVLRQKYPHTLLNCISLVE